MIAAKAINDKQGQAVEKLISVHESLREVYSMLDHQFRELVASMEMLRHTILHLREHSQVRAMSSSKSQGHDRKQTKACIKEHEQGNANTSSHESNALVHKTWTTDKSLHESDKH